MVLLEKKPVSLSNTQGILKEVIDSDAKSLWGIYQGIDLLIPLYLATKSFYSEGLEVTFYLRLQFNCHLNWKWLQSVRIGVSLDLPSMQLLLTGQELKKAGKSPHNGIRDNIPDIPHTDRFITCLRQKAPHAVQQQDSLSSKRLCLLYCSVTTEPARANWRPKKQLSQHTWFWLLVLQCFCISASIKHPHWPN